jgi:hypothetical protein
MPDQPGNRDKLNFSYSELGHKDCDWQTSGQNEDDLFAVSKNTRRKSTTW